MPTNENLQLALNEKLDEVNLDATYDENSVTITSSAGSSAIVNTADSTNAGVMSSGMFDKLNNTPIIEIVTEFPASPVEGVLYFVTE